MIKGLAHACFIVRDLDVTIDYYCNKLGLKPAFDFINDEGKRSGVYVHAGGRGFIEFYIGKAKPADEMPEGQRPSYQHLCLEVEDFDGTIAELRRRGVAVRDIRVGKDRSHQAWLTDPDGNVIELHGYTPQSKQGPYLA